jgi:hypothetical protein
MDTQQIQVAAGKIDFSGMAHLNAGQALVSREHCCRQAGQSGSDDADVIFFSLGDRHQIGGYNMCLIRWKSDTG